MKKGEEAMFLYSGGFIGLDRMYCSDRIWLDCLGNSAVIPADARTEKGASGFFVG